MPKIGSVKLYLNECYTCRSKKYEPLHQWFISLGLPLCQFKTYRVPLDRGWRKYANTLEQNAGIKLPFVVLQTDKGAIVYQYNRFLEEGIKMFSKQDAEEIWKNIMLKKVKDSDVSVISVKKQRKVKTKKTSMKKDETISTDVEA